jgi:hypothetical protein
VDSAIEKKRLFTGRSSLLMAAFLLMVGAARATLVQVEAPSLLRVTIELVRAQGDPLLG